MIAGSVIVAVGEVDRRAFPPPFDATLATLRYADGSARALAAIAGARAIVHGAEATVDRARRAIAALAEEAARKTVLVSFSGHGVQLVDAHAQRKGGLTDSWCLRDGFLRDEDVIALLAKFPETATVIVVSDCCYAGGIVDARDAPRTDAIRATVVTLAASGPNAPAFADDDGSMSAFVSALKTALGAKPPPRSYAELDKELRDKLSDRPASQVPRVGVAGKGKTLADVRPFWLAE